MMYEYSGVLAEIHTQSCVFWSSWKESTAQVWCVIKRGTQQYPAEPAHLFMRVLL